MASRSSVLRDVLYNCWTVIDQAKGQGSFKLYRNLQFITITYSLPGFGKITPESHYIFSEFYIVVSCVILVHEKREAKRVGEICSVIYPAPCRYRERKEKPRRCFKLVNVRWSAIFYEQIRWLYSRSFKYCIGIDVQKLLSYQIRVIGIRPVCVLVDQQFRHFWVLISSPSSHFNLFFELFPWHAVRNIQSCRAPLKIT